MRKLLAVILVVPLIYFFLWLIPVILEFAEFLFILDNTEFGFPWWLDLLIDSVAGAVAFGITKAICLFVSIKSKESKETISNVISILVGFAIAVVVHIFMKYWIIIVSLIAVAIVTYVLFTILKKKKNSELKKNI